MARLSWSAFAKERLQLRLHTSGHACGSTTKNLKAIVEEAIYEMAPDLTSLAILEPEDEPSSGFVPLQSLLKHPLAARGACRLRKWAVPIEIASYLSNLSCLRKERPIMTTGTPPPLEQAFATLRQFARPRPAVERCELCSAGLAHEHPHLVEPLSRQIVCACDACAMLFDGMAGAKFKRVSRRAQLLTNFRMTDAQWENLLIPINMAFFFHSSPEEQDCHALPQPGRPC